jgi:hypothetical protein
MRQFAARLRQDLAAVRNAISEPRSNGQTEGQINRLKTLKRLCMAAPVSSSYVHGCFHSVYVAITQFEPDPRKVRQTLG